jgi:hypothetical protein
MNHTIVEKIWMMLWDTGLSIGFWGECAHTAVYLINLCIVSALNKSTPYEMWHGHKPSILHLRPFRCEAYAHIPKTHHTKLDLKTWKCIMIGYQPNLKAYRLWDPTHCKAFAS